MNYLINFKLYETFSEKDSWNNLIDIELMEKLDDIITKYQDNIQRDVDIIAKYNFSVRNSNFKQYIVVYLAEINNGKLSYSDHHQFFNKDGSIKNEYNPIIKEDIYYRIQIYLKNDYTYIARDYSFNDPHYGTSRILIEETAPDILDDYDNDVETINNLFEEIKRRFPTVEFIKKSRNSMFSPEISENWDNEYDGTKEKYQARVSLEFKIK